MTSKKVLGWTLAVCSGLTITAAGQEERGRHGRKYKAPLETSHIEVTVVKSYNGKPIQNAAVIFHSVKDGKDEGNLEVKTDPDGKATIDVIATGSQVRVQVIAGGFATFGQDYMIDTAAKEIAIAMVRPTAQVSAYTGTTEERKLGVQEPKRATAPGVPPAGSTAPKTPPVLPPAKNTAPVSVPGAGSPPSL